MMYSFTFYSYYIVPLCILLILFLYIIIIVIIESQQNLKLPNLNLYNFKMIKINVFWLLYYYRIFSVKFSSMASASTSRSTKLKNFFWNKLASVRKNPPNSSVNLSSSRIALSAAVTSIPSGGHQIESDLSESSSSNKLLNSSNTVCNASEKKQRRNIFHIFERSFYTIIQSKF